MRDVCTCRPKRVGHVWNRRWQTDLSQNARLAAPMPALQAQILLVRAEEDSKVCGHVGQACKARLPHAKRGCTHVCTW